MIEPYEEVLDPLTDEIISIPNEGYNPVENNEKLYSKLLKLSNIPESYWNLSFEDYKGEGSKEYLNKAIQYSQNFDDSLYDTVNLYLYGPNRTQKTMIMCAIGREQIRKNYKVVYFQANQLQNILLNQINFNPDKEQKKMQDKLYNKYYDLILIDDIFSSVKQFMWRDGKGDYIISLWDEFFRNAFQNKQRIIVTSNTRMIEIKNIFSQDLQELLLDYMYELYFFDSIKEEQRKWKDEVWE